MDCPKKSEQSNYEIKSKTISGFFWRFGERIAAQLVSFIVYVVLARILLPNDYGVVAIVNVFVTIVSSIAVGGMGTALVQKKDSDEVDFSTIFFISLILATTLYIILFFCSPLIAKLYKNELLCSVLRVQGLIIFIFAINSIQQAYINKHMMFKKFFLATFIGTVISGVVGVILALTGAGVWALVAQQLTNSTIDTIILFITVKWHPKFVFSWKSFKQLFSFGWKVTVTGFIGNFFDKLRNLLIGAKYTSADLAFYNRGESLPLLLTSNINSTLDSVLFPAMSKLQDDKQALKNAMRRATKIGTYILMPLLSGLAAVSHNLVLILFTEKWIECVPFIIIVCIGELPGTINSANMQAIKALGRSDILLILEFIKKPLYLIIIIISAWFSPMILAIGHAFYGIVALIINAIPNYKLLKYSIFEQFYDVLNNLILSLIMAFCVYFIGKLPFNIYLLLFIQICAGIMIYILSSLITRNENFSYILNIIKTFLNKRKNQNVKN